MKLPDHFRKAISTLKDVFGIVSTEDCRLIGLHGTAEQVATVYKTLLETEAGMPDPLQHFGGLTARMDAYERWESRCRRARRIARQCVPGLHQALREGRPENLQTACKFSRENTLAVLLEGLTAEERTLARSAMTPQEMTETIESRWVARICEKEGISQEGAQNMYEYAQKSYLRGP